MKPLLHFKHLLTEKNISFVADEKKIICSAGNKIVDLELNILNRSLITHAPEKLVALIQSKLGLNKTVFARNCSVNKIAKAEAKNFLDSFHLMNSTQSAFNYGLFLKEELLAVASFSKGRKMNRLPPDKRSFELIRFCCKEGITITGGLTKLLKNFCKEKNAGDVMTYIDKQFSAGESFIKAGFKFHSETPPTHFLINKKTLEKFPVQSPDQKFDTDKFILTQNEGNIKLIYTPLE